MDQAPHSAEEHASMAPGSDRTTHSSTGGSSHQTLTGEETPAAAGRTMAPTRSGHPPALHPEIAKHVSPEYDYRTDEAEREIRDWGGDAPALPFIPRKRGFSNAALNPPTAGGHPSTSPHQPPSFVRPGEGLETTTDARAGAPIRKRTRSGTVWSEGGYPELTHVDTAFSDAHRAFSRLSKQRESAVPAPARNVGSAGSVRVATSDVLTASFFPPSQVPGRLARAANLQRLGPAPRRGTTESKKSRKKSTGRIRTRSSGKTTIRTTRRIGASRSGYLSSCLDALTDFFTGPIRTVKYKWIITILCAHATLVVTFASSAPSSATSQVSLGSTSPAWTFTRTEHLARHQQVAEQFNSGNEVAELTTALFLAGCKSQDRGIFSCLGYTHALRFLRI
jgi:hypothetical protein